MSQIHCHVLASLWNVQYVDIFTLLNNRWKAIVGIFLLDKKC